MAEGALRVRRGGVDVIELWLVLNRLCQCLGTEKSKLLSCATSCNMKSLMRIMWRRLILTSQWSPHLTQVLSQPNPSNAQSPGAITTPVPLALRRNLRLAALSQIGKAGTKRKLSNPNNPAAKQQITNFFAPKVTHS